MPDPKVLAELVNCYREGGEREFDRNTREGLKKSLSKCHDVNHAIIRVSTEQWVSMGKLERSLRRTKLVLGVLNAFLAMVAAVLALLKFLP